MYTIEELYTALRVLQNVCAQHEDCETCPFRTENGVMAKCRVSCEDCAPYDWAIPGDYDKMPEPRLDF